MPKDEQFTVDQLNTLIELNFAIAPLPEVTERYGYIRKLVGESEESLNLLRSICTNRPNLREATYSAFVAGVMTGLLLAETKKL